MTPAEALLLLNMLPEMTAARFRRLLDFYRPLPAVFEAALPELQAVGGLPENVARKILQINKQGHFLEREKEDMERHGIGLSTVLDGDYPESLRNLSDAPPVLYYKGNRALLKELSIALVGSRKMTPYGAKAAQTLTEGLCQAGLAVVSGLALGIDTVAHETALALNGGTVAVLGSGLLNIYPRENKRLSETVAEKGLLLSEFSLQAQPLAIHFPRRNRIVAALSLGTVVVEADIKSGALVTAKLAAEQGKDVFAVPGPIFSTVSSGTHFLIRQGAKLAACADDVLEEILPQRVSSLNLNKGRDGIREADLAPREKDLLGSLSLQPLHIDVLSSKNGIASGELSEALLNLELKGMVKSLPGKMYVRN